MKTKFIMASLAVGILSFTACRESDETVVEEAALQKSMTDEADGVGKEGDPPKDTTHWRSAKKDSTKAPKDLVGLRSDSLAVLSPSTGFENGPKDPPRDTTHWRKK